MKSILREKPYLIIAVVVLLLANFVVEPIITWQNSEVEKLKLQSKLVKKYETIYAKKEQYNAAYETSRKNLDSISGYFYPYIEPSEFQLSRQVEFEKKLKELSLVSNGVSWSRELIHQDEGIISHTLTLNIEGTSSAILGLFVYVESANKYLIVDSFNLRMKDKRFDEVLPQATGWIKVQFFLLGADSE